MATNENDNKAHGATQNAKIKEWLESGNTITSLEALKMFGCMRLASRICDLRERGMVIQKKKVVTKNGKIVTMYYL